MTFKDEIKDELLNFLDLCENVIFYHTVDFQFSKNLHKGYFKREFSKYKDKKGIQDIWAQGLFRLPKEERGFIELVYNEFERKYSIHLAIKLVKEVVNEYVNVEVQQRDIFIKIGATELENEPKISLRETPRKKGNLEFLIDSVVTDKNFINSGNYLLDHELRSKIKNIIAKISVKGSKQIENNLKNILGRLLRFLFPSSSFKQINYSVFIVPAYTPKNIEITSGGVAVFYKEFSKEDIIKIGSKTALWSSLETANNLLDNIKSNSTFYVISQVLSRNFSHNIGSHVMHNADLGKIINKLNHHTQQFNSIRNELNAHRYASALKSILDQYVVERNEYLADVSENTMPSGNYAKFYGEVVMSFVENFLLTDNIAAAEGIGFPSPQEDNRLQIRVFLDEDKELVTLYDAYSNSDGGKLLRPGFQAGYPNVEEVRPHGEKLRLPFCLPLLEKGFGFEQDSATLELIESKQIESFFNTKKIIVRNTITNQYDYENDAGDVEIAIPGVLGRHAFYSLLENFVRNSAKHNKEKLKGQNLTLELHLSTIDEEDIEEGRFRNKHDAWKVTLASTGLDWVTCDQFEKLEEYVNAPLISSQTGITRTTGLGIADMVVSASVLAGSFDFDFSESKPQNKYFRIKKLEEQNGKIRFAYNFYLLKAKRIICLTKNELAPKDKKSWLAQGITLVSNVEAMYNHMGKQSYRMAVLDAELLDQAFRENHDDYEKLLSRLPFRVIIMETPGNNYANKYWRKLAAQRRLIIYENKVENKSPSEFHHLCWEQWLMRFYPELKEQQLLPLQLHLYLEHKHRKWEEASKKNFGDFLRLHVYTPENDDFRHETGSINLIYDHHGRLLSKMAGKADFIENDSYTIFDKNSTDFPRLLYPDENSIEVLPYIMTEAALMRILVMDERVAERANLNADMESKFLGSADPKFKKVSHDGTTINDTMFELAWAGGVHIGTHYQINNQPIQALNEKIKHAKNAPQLTFRIETDRSGKFGKIRFLSNLPGRNGGEYQAGANHYHMLLIHRTILKQIQESVRRICPDFQFLKEIKNVIPFTVVDSGGGYPEEIRSDYKGSFKFLPFSFMSEHLLRNRIAKVGLTQLLMGLTDAKRE